MILLNKFICIRKLKIIPDILGISFRCLYAWRLLSVLYNDPRTRHLQSVFIYLLISYCMVKFKEGSSGSGLDAGAQRGCCKHRTPHETQPHHR